MEKNIEGIDEIKEIEIEKNNQTENPIHRSQTKGDKENEADAQADSEISKKNIYEKLKQNWEGFLGMKLLTFKEYENLNKKSRIFNLIKFSIIIILLIAFVSSIFWFISIYKDKDFSQDINLNNTVNIPQDNINVPVNVNINQTSPTILINATIPIQINATININQVIVNST
jgi:hypothetical protein